MRKTLFMLFFMVVLSDMYAQKFQIGLLSGTNFSDIHIQNSYLMNYRWKTNKGPTSGIYMSCDLSPIFSINSEFNYSTLYYERKSELGNIVNFDYSIWPIYNPDHKFQLNLFRIPVYLKMSTPGRIKFQLSVGAFLSFVENYEANRWSEEISSMKNDKGYFYSAGVSYDITNNWNMFLHGRYLTGRNRYEFDEVSKLASYEIILGIGYTGLFQKKQKSNSFDAKIDTAGNRLSMKYKMGLNSSWMKPEYHGAKYSQSQSLLAGVSFKYKFDKNLAWVTEIIYERKGYNFKDSSAVDYKYYEDNGMKKVFSQIDFDYIIIPLLLNLDVGQSYTFYLSTGPYIGLLLDAKYYGETWKTYVTDYSYSSYHENVYNHLESKISKMDWGLSFNAGFQLPVYKEYKLDLEVRYNYGLKQIYEETKISHANNEKDDFKNRSLNISIGFVVPF